jgi:two-component system, NarL family, response regulator LiaR
MSVQKMQKILRVCLVDDHPVYLDGVRASLLGCPSIILAGTASTGQEALQKIPDLDPAVTLVDLGLPDMTGVELSRKLLTKSPDMHVLWISSYLNSGYVGLARSMGVSGCVSKSVSGEELLDAILRAARGEEVVRLGRTSKAPGLSLDLRGAPPVITQMAGLSPRQIQVLRGVAFGMANKTIADRLRIGVRTVQTHRREIYQKLNVRSTAEATRYAVMHGLLNGPDLDLS